MPEINSLSSLLSRSALDILHKSQPESSEYLSHDETPRAAEVLHSYPPIMANYTTNNHFYRSLTQTPGSTDVDQTVPEKLLPSILPCPSIQSSCSSSSCDSNSSTPSPTARWRRSPSPECCPKMVIHSTYSTHILAVVLPRAIQSEMVTVSVKKGDRLDIVADAWHMEHDCHYEWQVHFASCDADMSSVRARFAPDGKLSISVQRRISGQAYGCGQMGGIF